MVAESRIGDEPFVKKTERLLSGRRRGRAQDADLALPRPSLAPELIDACVSEHFGVRAEELRTHGRHVGPAKFVAIELACRLTDMTQRAVGGLYGHITSAAVSIVRRKIRSGEYTLSPIIQALQERLTRARDQR